MITPSQSPSNRTKQERVGRQRIGLPRIGALLLIVLATIVTIATNATNATAATLELTGPAGATVSLNDRVLGQFPLDGPLDLPPGRYTVRCQEHGFVPYEQDLRLTSIQDWQRLSVRLTPFSRKTAWTSNILFAGLGQHYLGNSFRGYLYNTAEAGGLLAALAGEMQRSNLEKDYLKLVDIYSNSIDAEEIVTVSNEADAKYQDMKDMEELRDLGLMVAGGAIVVSIIDAIITFPSVTAGGGTVPVDTSSIETPWNDTETDHALHAGLRLTF